MVIFKSVREWRLLAFTRLLMQIIQPIKPDNATEWQNCTASFSKKQNEHAQTALKWLAD